MTRRTLTLLAGSAALLAAATGVTGCAAGNFSATSQAVTAINGVNAEVGSILIRNLHLIGQSHGDQASAFGTFLNTGGEADTLTSVSVDEALRVDLVDGDGIDLSGGITVPANGVTTMTASGPHLQLVGLKEPAVPGRSITVILRFEKAGEETLTVPVEPGQASSLPSPTPTASPTATTSITGAENGASTGATPTATP